METLPHTGYASRRTALFLRENRRGRVLMANSAGIYLELDGKILLLCDEGWGAVPNGIGLPDYKKTASVLALKAGEEVFCRDGCLHFGKNWIKIAKRSDPAPAVGTRVCRLRWQEGLEALRGREKGLAPLAAALLDGAPERGEPLWALALPRLKELERGLLAGDESAVEQAAVSLLGLGPGLTPSGDDVLCGLLRGLQGSPREKNARILAEAVCREAGRTHPVSAGYLQAIAGGEAFDRLDRAWAYLTGQGEACLEALLEVGSSSGGDLLLGLLLAGKICLKREAWTDGGTERAGIMG